MFSFDDEFVRVESIALEKKIGAEKGVIKNIVEREEPLIEGFFGEKWVSGCVLKSKLIRA